LADNQHVAEAIAAHHAEMVATLARAVQALAHAIEQGNPWTAARESLQAYADSNLLPHAAAEESTLYARAQRDPALVPLVQSMLSEHQALRRWRDTLDAATRPTDALLAAGALHGLFSEHAAKEENWLVPALARKPDVDLALLLGELRAALTGRHGE
jgi:hypothetical protein